MGYFTNNNFLDHSLYVGYRYTEPKGWYNRLNFNFNASLSRLYAPIEKLESKFQSVFIKYRAASLCVAPALANLAFMAPRQVVAYGLE